MGVTWGCSEITPELYRELSRDPAPAELLLRLEDIADEELAEIGCDRERFESLHEGVLQEFTEVDKAWNGIHFLLTGRSRKGPDVLSMAVYGGAALDLMNGTHALLSPEETKAVASALLRVSEKELRARFDPKAMERGDVYPDGLWQDTNALDYLLSYYPNVVEFYTAVAGRGNAVLISTG